MLSIVPPPALPFVLADGAEPALLAGVGSEGAGFATELALAVRGFAPPAPARAGLSPVPEPPVRLALAPLATGDALIETVTLDPDPETTEAGTDPEPVRTAPPRPSQGEQTTPSARPGRETAAPGPANPDPPVHQVEPPRSEPVALEAFAGTPEPPEARMRQGDDQAPTEPRRPRTAMPSAALPRDPVAQPPPADHPTADLTVPAPAAVNEPAEGPHEVSDRLADPRGDTAPAPAEAAVAALAEGPGPEEPAPSNPTELSSAPAEAPAPEALAVAIALDPATRPTAARPQSRGAAGPVPEGLAAHTLTPVARGSTQADPTPAGRATPPEPTDVADPRPLARDRAGADPVPADRPASTDAPDPANGRAAEPSEPSPPRAEPVPRTMVQPTPLEAPSALQPAERASPVSAAPASPRVVPAPPAQQIAPVLITLAAAAHGMPDRLTLTLDPQELGWIEVEVTREGERRVAIAVLAERPETLHLLMRDAAVLDRALAQAGVGAEGRSLAFDLGGGSDGRRQRGGNPGAPDAAQTPHSEAARPRDPLSLLDIAI
ncbi:flagellar hook-length control protein FliK [Elioraea sp.]|uniref:flagellar hook-length control protein FliK n=1 Tax=Elioraea sp. TaxID=2185103 RepID=UPI003F700CE5